MAARPSNTETDSEVLAGMVERVTYHNAENGFCVLRVKARTSGSRHRRRPRRDHLRRRVDDRLR